MNKLIITTALTAIALTMGTGLASAQILNKIETATVDLTAVTTTTVMSYSGSGTITGFACKVTTAVTGSQAFQFIFVVDGTTYYLHGATMLGNTWPTNFVSIGTGGSSVGDFFTIPLNVPFTTSIVVQNPGVGYTTGAYLCNLYH